MGKEPIKVVIQYAAEGDAREKIEQALICYLRRKLICRKS